MARGRMLSSSVSTSEKMADLPDDRSRLIATWVIAHLDCEGRVTGNARRLRALVVPLLDGITVAHVEKAMEGMATVGIALRYTDEAGHEVLAFPGFAEHQIGLRKEREASSVFGAPPEELRSNSGPTPAEEKRREEKLREEKLREENGGTPRREAPSEPAPPDAPPSELESYIRRTWRDVKTIPEDAWKEGYPAVDLLAEARKAFAWEQRQPTAKRKKDHRAFLGRWFAKAQDDAAKGGNGPAGRPQRSVPSVPAAPHSAFPKTEVTPF